MSFKEYIQAKQMARNATLSARIRKEQEYVLLKQRKIESNQHTNWTHDEACELVELWNAGLTAREIAIKLQSKYKNTRTRNSVIGKVHRMKLDGRPSPIIRKEVEFEPVKITCYKRETDCAEDGCEGKKVRGSYCETHANIYYEKPNKQHKRDMKWWTSKF